VKHDTTSETLRPVSAEIPYRDPAEVYAGLRTTPSVLLDSAGGPLHLARYSFMAVDPYLTLRCRNGTLKIVHRGKRALIDTHPLKKLRELLAAVHVEPDPALPPFQGGAVGLFNYDFVRYVERFQTATHDDLLLPEADLLLTDRVIAWDHKTRTSWVIVVPGARETGLGYTPVPAPPSESADTARDEVRRLADRIATISGKKTREKGPRLNLRVEHEMAREDYEAMVRRAKEYITAGDIFQANLSQRIMADVTGIDPWDIYLALRGINPSPFAFYADFGDYVIASSSPERLIRFTPEQADTRPIAGTRPRGADVSEDDRMRSELLLNEKERAEHIMLLDLERNDLGKFCDYGSVVIDELMVTEDYSHVIHIVSNVRGRPARGKDWADAVRSTFPGGTITGVPKVRCMQIIDELEPFRRGPYTGSMGYISFDGRMDLNIVIRTFVIKDGTAYVQAGAGIVADSDPSREYVETLKKAEALIRTIEGL